MVLYILKWPLAEHGSLYKCALYKGLGAPVIKILPWRVAASIHPEAEETISPLKGPMWSPRLAPGPEMDLCLAQDDSLSPLILPFQVAAPSPSPNSWW